MEVFTLRKLKAVIIILLVILLFPIRLNFKDGGSYSYKSVVYEVTKIHQLSPVIEGGEPYIDGLEINILGITVYKKIDSSN